MSWNFWFNQHTGNVKKALEGDLYHSFNPTDRALNYYMRLNDYMFRGSLFMRNWHYLRKKLYNHPDKVYRAPKGKSSLAYRCPAMMKERKPPGPPIPGIGYGYKDLNLPAGATQINIADDNVNAYELGPSSGSVWRKNEHSDFLQRPYFKIYPWYEKILKVALPLGREE